MALIEQTHTRINLVTYEWTSDENGDATATTTHPYDGNIKCVLTIPLGGGDQPTDNYDLTITHPNGFDLCLGQCANRSNASIQGVTSGFVPVADHTLTFTVSNAGNAKSGVVLVYIE